MATTTTRPHSARPKLAQLKTPINPTFPSFPSELSAIPLSACRTPLSAFPTFHSIKMEEGVKTPITPPSAYTDFLKSCKSPAVSEAPQHPPFSRNNSDASVASTQSNITVESISSNSTSSSEDSSRSESVSPRSVPASEQITPLSCITMESVSGCSMKSPPPTAGYSSHPSKPQFALPKIPASAPLNSSGRMRLHIPASPAWSIHEVTSPLSNCGTPIYAQPSSANPISATPMSALCTSAVRSPFSARSHFDWESVAQGGPKSAAASARYFDSKSGQSPRISKAGVRHVREIVTRTVTYTSSNTPRMSPAPKGKRRRVATIGEGKLKKEVTAESQ